MVRWYTLSTLSVAASAVVSTKLNAACHGACNGYQTVVLETNVREIVKEIQPCIGQRMNADAFV